MANLKILTRLDMNAASDISLGTRAASGRLATASMIDGASWSVTTLRGGGEKLAVFAGGHSLFEAKGFGAALGGNVIDAALAAGDMRSFLANALRGNDVIVGSHESDTLRGYDGADFINAETGNDLVFGDGGNDLLNGRDGNDTVYGGTGDDRILGGSGNDLIDGGEGVDTALYAMRAAVRVDLALSTAQRTGVGLDRLVNIENLESGFGADALAGNEAANRLVAGAGNDTLAGRGGDDRLEGGLGDDLLTGGAGADLFVFAAGSGADRVADFADGEDRLVLTSGAAGFDELAISDGAGGAVVAWTGGSVTLAGVTAAELDAADFVFG